MPAIASVPAGQVRCGRLLETAAGLLDLPTGQPVRLSAEWLGDRDPRAWRPATWWTGPPLPEEGAPVDASCLDAWLTQDWLGRWVVRRVLVPRLPTPSTRAERAADRAVSTWPPDAWCGPSVYVSRIERTADWLALAADARREGVVPVHAELVERLIAVVPDACPPLLVGVPADFGRALSAALETWVLRGGRVHGLVRLPTGLPTLTPLPRAEPRPVGWRLTPPPAQSRLLRAVRRAWTTLASAPPLPAVVRIPLSPGDRPMTHLELLDVTTQLDDIRQDDEAVRLACRTARRHLHAAHTAVVAHGAADPQVVASDGPPASSHLAWRELCRAGAPDALVSVDGWHRAASHAVEQGTVWMCARWPSREAGERADLLAVFARLIAGRIPWADMVGTREPGLEHMLVGDSRVMQDVRAQIALAARAPFPVLIRGESGCGKELAARAIHALGTRRHRRVAAINCAALPDDLIESELFGHVRGAFTGAASDRLGLFDEADGGTLFLDEVGELGARAQAKLLRVLQDGEVRRVGENHARRVDVRVVAATNVSLEHAVRQGTFRADLFYRLDVVRVRMPALRERREDISQLARHFWHDCTARVGSRARLEGRVLEALARYDWPGNVRQLQNTLAALAVRVPVRGRVTLDDLPPEVRRPGMDALADGRGGLDAARREFEATYVREALSRAGGRPSTAARDLGVTRQGLSKIVRRLGLDDEPTGGSRLP